MREQQLTDAQLEDYALNIEQIEQEERLAIMDDGAPTRTGFHFKPAAILCEKPSEADWLIDRYMPKNKLMSTFGDAGSGKSCKAIDEGLSVASGIRWHGRRVSQGSVFYIAGEGFGGLGRRLKVWSIEHNIDLAGVPFFVSDRPAAIIGQVQEVITAIDEMVNIHGTPSLVIVDTLNRNFGAGDENSTSDMTAFVAALDSIRARYGCAISIVHHSGLSATDRARGASALRGALDLEYRLSKNPDGTRTLTCTKAKDHEEPEPLSFELCPVDTGWIDENENPITSCVLRQIEGVTPDCTRSLRGTRKLAYDCLLKLGGDAVDVDEWRMACYDAGISPASSSDAKRKAFKRAVSELRDMHLVSAKNDVWFANRPDTPGQTRIYNDLRSDF